jgi:histidinol phosphatase-like PHP family hydrolase
MALAARTRGLEYLAITDHSHRLVIAHALSADRLARQIDEIDRLNEELHRIVLLKGVEVDILEDGQLDLPDDTLSPLDIVVAAMHNHFGLSRARQNERILRALDSPYVSILAHPTGRLLLERDPTDSISTGFWRTRPNADAASSSMLNCNGSTSTTWHAARRRTRVCSCPSVQRLIVAGDCRNFAGVSRRLGAHGSPSATFATRGRLRG